MTMIFAGSYSQYTYLLRHSVGGLLFQASERSHGHQDCNLWVLGLPAWLLRNAVDSKKLESGPRTIYACFPSSLSSIKDQL